jgi:hypothetical protein
MIITNHVLAGAIIGLTVTNPVAAVILALVSHFVMDALPHFGYEGKKGYEEVLKHKLSYIVAISTLITTLSILVLLAVNGQWFAILIGLVAASPDGVGLYNWLAYEKRGTYASGWLKWLHVKFHRAIQWCERPWGVWVEMITSIALGYIFIKLL